MSERMTAEELAEIEKRHASVYPNATGLPDIEVVRNVVHHAAWSHSDRGKLLAHLRTRTHTPGVTGERVRQLIRQHLTIVDRDPAYPESYSKLAGVEQFVLALLAEKPAHTVTPLTTEQINVVYDILVHENKRALGDQLLAILSASPTAQENER
jgi:hypothetical protein